MAVVPVCERLKEAMEFRGVSQVDIVRMARPLCEKRGLKLYKSKLSQYVSGDFKPGSDMNELLAEVLEVNPAWLAGFDVPMKRETPTSDESAGERMERMNALYPRLSPFEQKRILALIEKKLPR